ncbi:preprotein translocase subunit SecD [Thiohalospira halophila DSM 15071]|uniref:Protein translocase subunit SecD n=1 Tax=Thiohalospira halophila DSM 15071 TaxID=1123397 RepID=A0A1I1QXN6_9GAMM|nr:protein translocase subunit SecD [Thiohalospira halophila]SFD24033.1 preprotein translocase subunit SecD [Thiohalospira halophila DSM 15071]
MNRYPLWKYLLILAILVVAGLYALPNLYGQDPAIQINAEDTADVDEGVRETVLATLDDEGATEATVQRQESGALLVRLADTGVQGRVADRLRARLGPDFTVALNLAPAAPQWLRDLGAYPMFLGLDLRGGVHFLMDVDMEAALQAAVERYESDFRSGLREQRLRYTVLRSEEGTIQVAFTDAGAREEAVDYLDAEFDDLDVEAADIEGRPGLEARLTEDRAREVRDFALQQNITTLRSRVNELGVAEPIIQRQGDRRVVVQLPGVQDTARAKDILGATATLEFRLVHEDNGPSVSEDSRVPPDARLLRERSGEPILLERRVIVTGDAITDASSGLDQQSGSPAVYISLDGQGAAMMSRITRDNIGELMAVVFIENETRFRETPDGGTEEYTEKVEEVINVARIRDELAHRFQITGLDSSEEARNLALLLRAGALAAPMDIVEERTVGPSLGAENIDRGFASVIVGFVLVLAFMIFWYRGFGLVADAALAANLVVIVAVLSMMQATLTMPGIAGIVLTVGMAVDANVLIFERIREEIRNGNTPQASIAAGYDKALSTIADANVTTLIAALVLFGFGTGPVKGFAVTLSIGIVTSMFTAIMLTRAIVNLTWGRKKRLDRVSIG